MKHKLVYFNNDYTQTEKDFLRDEGNIVAAITIDGYPADENAEGEVVATIYITAHGDYVVDWRRREYQNEQRVQELVESSKRFLQTLWAVKESAKKETAKEIVKRLRNKDSYFDDPRYDQMVDDIAVDFGLRNPYTGLEEM